MESKGGLRSADGAEGAAYVAARHWQSIFDAIGDGLALLDRECKILCCNQAVGRLLGKPGGELSGRSYHELVPVLSGRLEAFSCRGMPELPQRQSVDLPMGGRWLNLTADPVWDEAGVLTGAVCIISDVTTRKRGEEALARQMAELQRSNEGLRQFALIASHDLQEPLRTVATYVQLLADRYRGKLDADVDEFIGYVVEGVTRMRTLIEGLLRYSSIETREQEFTAVNCEALLERTLGTLRALVEESGAVVTYGSLPPVRGDAVQLGQVWQNLISNAIKFRGTESPRVHIAIRQQGDQWEFSVRDNGIGIKPQDAERVFGPFQRLHPGKQRPGMGMGLAICKKIVERHGGRIWVESEPGQGATFFFTLPMESV